MQGITITQISVHASNSNDQANSVVTWIWLLASRFKAWKLHDGHLRDKRRGNFVLNRLWSCKTLEESKVRLTYTYARRETTHRHRQVCEFEYPPRHWV